MSRGGEKKAKKAQDKTPKVRVVGLGRKAPTVDPSLSPESEAIRNSHPIFSFDAVDMDGTGTEWGWSLATREELIEAFAFLKDFETKPWHEIHSKNFLYHFVPVYAFCKAARDRMAALSCSKEDELFRLRLGNTKRIYGFLVDGVFKPVWWDPLHTANPTEPKNT